MVKKVKSNRDMRFAVMVMGMHRSGTSALSGVLTRLGCEAPRDLMPAAPQNPKGFYESLSISALNDALLGSGGSKWYTWQEFNKGWYRSPKMPDFLDQAEAALGQVFDNARLIALKDPRISLLVPFWDEALRQSGYTPLYLHTHRHPLEVAASLETWAAADEDRLPGYDPRYGQLLWLRYVLEAEVATRGQTRHFTSYDRLLADWRREMDSAAEALNLAWPMLSASVADEIDGYLGGPLNHEASRLQQQGGAPRLLPWVAQCHEIFERWAQQGENAEDFPVLDQILAEFNATAPMFGPFVETGRQRKAEQDQVRREAEALRQMVEASTAEARALEASLNLARSEQAEADAALRSTKEQMRALQEQATSAHESSDDLEASTRHAADRIAALESELAQRRAETDDLTKELTRLNTERAALQAALDAANDRNAALQESAQDKAHELEQLRAKDVATHQALEAERERRSALEQRLDEKARALEQARAQISALNAEADAGRQSAQALAEEREKSASLAAKNAELAQTARTDQAALEQKLRAEYSQSEQQWRDRESSVRAEAAAFETGLTALRKSLDDLRADQQTQQDAVAATTAQLMASRSELDSMRRAHAALESEREQYQRELRLERSRENDANKKALLDAVQSARMRSDDAARAAEEHARETIARVEAETAAARREQELAQERLRAAEHRVNELLNSTSWRLTGPLRRFVTALRSRRR